MLLSIAGVAVSLAPKLQAAAGGGWREWPTRVTVFLALNPVTAALQGRLLLGEPLPATLWMALGLIAASLWLATRAPASTAH